MVEAGRTRAARPRTSSGGSVRTRARARPAQLDSSSSSPSAHTSRPRALPSRAAAGVVPPSSSLELDSDPDSESDLDSIPDDGAHTLGLAGPSRFSAYFLSRRSPGFSCPDSQAQPGTANLSSPAGPSRIWSFPTHVRAPTPRRSVNRRPAAGDGREHDGEQDDDEEEEMQLELPPGNQQAVSRAFLREVAASDSSPVSASRTGRLPSSSVSGHQRSSLPPKHTVRPGAAAAAAAAASPTRAWTLGSPASSLSTLTSASASPASRHLQSPAAVRRPRIGSSRSPLARRGTEFGSPRNPLADDPQRSSSTAPRASETDIGYGSLHRGLIVPSSDNEDDDQFTSDSNSGTVTLRWGSERPSPAALRGSAPAVPSGSAERPRVLSTQAMLRRRLPAFCAPLFAAANGEADVVAETQIPAAVEHGECDDGDTGARADPSEMAAGKDAHAETTEEEEYDESAHMRDSAAAAAEEPLLPPSFRPRRPRQPPPALSSTKARPDLGLTALHPTRARSQSVDDGTTESESAQKLHNAESTQEEGVHGSALLDSAAAASGNLLLAHASRSQRSQTSLSMGGGARRGLDRTGSRPVSLARWGSQSLGDATTESECGEQRPTEVQQEPELALPPAAAASAAPRQVSLTPPPPTPPPGLADLASHFAFAPSRQTDSNGQDSTHLEPPRLEARAEQCEIIQIERWHRNPGRGRGRGRGRPPGSGAKGKGKAVEEAAPVVIADMVDLDADTVDLSAIGLELIRPLAECPICGVTFPKSRTGPAKRTHMGGCARNPPAHAVERLSLAGIVGAAPASPTKKAQDQSLPVQPIASTSAAEVQVDGRPLPLTPLQVYTLINTHLDTLIGAERARQQQAASSRTLFAHFVGDGLAAEAALAAARAKEARERERKVHLDNLYAGQGELPKDYRPRKRRKKGKGKGKETGEEEDDAQRASAHHRALVRLIAKRDAETAKRREAILRAPDSEGEDTPMGGLGAAHLSGVPSGPDFGDTTATAGAATSEAPALVLPATDATPTPDKLRTRRSPSLAPSHVSASTAHTALTRSPSAWSPLKAQRLRELETSLVPASEGRARAAAYAHELFPPTQVLSQVHGRLGALRHSWLGAGRAVPDSQGVGAGGSSYALREEEEDHQDDDARNGPEAEAEGPAQGGWIVSPVSARMRSPVQLTPVLSVCDDNSQSQERRTAGVGAGAGSSKHGENRSSSAVARRTAHQQDAAGAGSEAAASQEQVYDPIMGPTALPAGMLGGRAYCVDGAEEAGHGYGEASLPPATQKFGHSRLADKYGRGRR